MKCIKNKEGEIRRVKEEEADLKVLQYGWVFVPKSEWKALRKPKKTESVIDQSTEVVELSIEEKRLARKKKNK
jgi:hypothetical protein